MAVNTPGMRHRALSCNAMVEANVSEQRESLILCSGLLEVSGDSVEDACLFL